MESYLTYSNFAHKVRVYIYRTIKASTLQHEKNKLIMAMRGGASGNNTQVTPSLLRGAHFPSTCGKTWSSPGWQLLSCSRLLLQSPQEVQQPPLASEPLLLEANRRLAGSVKLVTESPPRQAHQRDHYTPAHTGWQGRAHWRVGFAQLLGTGKKIITVKMDSCGEHASVTLIMSWYNSAKHNAINYISLL